MAYTPTNSKSQKEYIDMLKAQSTYGGKTPQHATVDNKTTRDDKKDAETTRTNIPLSKDILNIIKELEKNPKNKLNEKAIKGQIEVVTYVIDKVGDMLNEGAKKLKDSHKESVVIMTAMTGLTSMVEAVARLNDNALFKNKKSITENIAFLFGEQKGNGVGVVDLIVQNIAKEGQAFTADDVAQGRDYAMTVMGILDLTVKGLAAVDVDKIKVTKKDIDNVFKAVNDILMHIASLTSNKKTSSLASKSKDIKAINNTMKSLSSVFDNVNGVLKDVSEMGLLALPARSGAKMMMLALPIIIGGDDKHKDNNILAILSSQLAGDDTDFDAVSEGAEQVAGIMGSVKDLMATTALAGLLAIPAALGGLLVVVAMKSIGLVMNEVDKNFGDKKAKETTESLRTFSLAMLSLSGSVLVLALASLVVTKSWGGLLKTIGLLAAVVGAMWLINKFFNGKKSYEGVTHLGLAMLTLSGAVLILALTSNIVESNIKQIGLTLLLLVGVSAVMVGISWAMGPRTIRDIKSFALTVLLLVGTTVALAFLGQYVTGEVAGNVFKALGLMAGVVALFTLIGLAQQLVKGGAITMLIVAGVTAAMSLTIFLLSEAGKQLNDENTWKGILRIGAVFGVLVGAMMVLGGLFAIPVVGPALIAGTAAAELLIGGVVALAAGMAGVATVLAKAGKLMVTVDVDKFEKNGLAMVGTLKDMADEAAGIKIKDVGNLRKMKRMTRYVVDIALSVKKIADLEMNEYDERGHPTGKKVQMRPTDFAAAAENGRLVVTTMADIVSYVQDAFSDGIERSTKVAFRRLNQITRNIFRMTWTVQKMASLEIPDYDDNGVLRKDTGRRQMRLSDFDTALENGKLVVSAIVGIIDYVEDEFSDGVTRSTKRAFRRLNAITKSIFGMAATVQKIASLEIPDYDEQGRWDGKTHRQMSDSDFKIAVDNGGRIISSILDIVTNNMSKIDTVDALSRRKFRQLNNIVGNIGNMALTIQRVASLMVPHIKDGQWDGKTFRPMRQGDFKLAADNASKLVMYFAKLFGEEEDFDNPFGGGKITPIKTEVLANISRKTKNKMKYLNDIIKPISSMTDIVCRLSDKDERKIRAGVNMMSLVTRGTIHTIADAFKWYDGTDMDADKVIDKAESVEDLFKIVNKIDYNYIDKVSKYRPGQISGATGSLAYMIRTLNGAVNTASRQRADVFERNVKSASMFIDKIDGSNIDNLRTVRDTFYHISRLAGTVRGDMVKLADTISNDLIDKLSELIDKLGDLKEGVNGVGEAAASAGARTQPTAQGTTGRSSVLQPTRPDNANGNLQGAITSLQSTIASLSSKLGNISNTLNGTGVKVYPKDGTEWNQ